MKKSSNSKEYIKRYWYPHIEKVSLSTIMIANFLDNVIPHIFLDINHNCCDMIDHDIIMPSAHSKYDQSIVYHR